MKLGGTYTFSYAPLETILAGVRGPLKENGLSLTQNVIGPKESEMVRTQLLHSSGQRLSCDIPILLKEAGPQAYGSGLSYARRYGMTLLLCLCADDDDDGNRAEGNQVTNSPKRQPRSDKGTKRIGKPQAQAESLPSAVDTVGAPSAPDPKSFSSTNEYITQGQAANFEKSFREACPAGLNALEESHKWLFEMGFFGGDGNPTAKRIPIDKFQTVKTAAVAYARGL